MAYQSKHTGANIDAGIDINTTQNNRLTALENKDTTLSSQITTINNSIKTINTSISDLTSEMNELKNLLTLFKIILRVITTNTSATLSCTNGTFISQSNGIWDFEVPSYGTYTINFTANGTTITYSVEAKYIGINECKLNYTYILTVDDMDGKFKVCTQSISGNMYDGYPGFTIVGTNSANRATGQPRLDIKYDLTNVKKIIYFARKNVNHGNAYCRISDGVLDSGMVQYGSVGDNYHDLSTSWTSYTLDTSKITGTKTISFEGGYSDSSGSTSSSTSFGKIQFVY